MILFYKSQLHGPYYPLQAFYHHHHPSMVKGNINTPKPSMFASNHPYKGVRMRRWGSWVSEIRAPNQKTRIWLGFYSNPEAAARAYDAALLYIKGSSADLNFPESLSRHQKPTTLVSPKFIQRAAAAAANNDASPTTLFCSESPPSPPSPLLSKVTESNNYATTSPSCVTAQWLDFADLESPRFTDLLLGQSGLYTPLEDQCQDESDLMSLWSFP